MLGSQGRTAGQGPWSRPAPSPGPSLQHWACRGVGCQSPPRPREPGWAAGSWRDGPAPHQPRCGHLLPQPPCLPLSRCLPHGSAPPALNHEQISHSQQEARRTRGGDTAFKAISTELARQMEMAAWDRMAGPPLPSSLYPPGRRLRPVCVLRIRQACAVSGLGIWFCLCSQGESSFSPTWCGLETFCLEGSREARPGLQVLDRPGCEFRPRPSLWARD